jgi:predicted Zn-dependent protease
MRALLTITILLTLLSPAPSQASDWGHVNGKQKNHWTDIDDARPDIYPDAWLVANLARSEGDEVQLRTASGGMLRLVETRQQRILYAIQQSIEKAAEIEVELYLMPGDEPNASAGIREGVKTVFINFAMLDMVGAEVAEWAALLGHEVAHLKLDHHADRARRSLPLGIIKNVGQGLLAGDWLASTATGFLIDGIGSKFSRDAEREADYMGVIWAVEKGFDPYGAANLHEKMNERKNAGMIPPFLNTHPSGPERIQSLRSIAGRLAPQTD